jgi:hypothetical protein
MRLRWLVVLGTGLLLVIAATRTVPAFKAFQKSDKAALSEADRVSYAVGMTLAAQLRAQAIQVDPDLVSRALRDVLSDGKRLLTNEEARTVMVAVQKGAKARRAALLRDKVHRRRDPSAANQGSRANLGFAFKLDPRLIGGAYGNADRWVSGPSYLKVGDGKTCTFDVKVHRADTDAEAISATWTPADPAMVKIEPARGTQVRMIVQRPGETRVHVESDAGSKDLTIKAVYENNVLQAEISQQ